MHSACLCHGTAAAEGRAPREADAGHAAYVRVCSFYGAAAVGSGEAGGALRTAAELLAEPRAAEALGRTVAFQAESAAAAAEQVRPYVDSADARAASSSRVTTNSRSRVLVWFTSVTVTSASGAQGASTWRNPPRGLDTK